MVGGKSTMADQTQDDQAKTKSRYELVKQILNDAQGDAHPSYQGHGKFWELPLDEFLKVTIYGVRMIAPAGEEDFCQDQMMAGGGDGSCCESAPEDESPAESPAQPSDASSEGSADHSCCGSSASA